MTKPKSTPRAPWAKAVKRSLGELAVSVARTIEASAAIDAGRCPNGCGRLDSLEGSYAYCAACGFEIGVYNAPVVDPRPTFNRRPTSRGRHDHP